MLNRATGMVGEQVRLREITRQIVDREASAGRGAYSHTSAGVPGLSVTESGPRKLLGRVGDGGPSVELRAERGEVRLTTPSPASAEAE